MLAFVPPPEQDLRNNLYFGVSSSTEREWNGLADNLSETAILLIAKYSIPAVAPYTAKAWKYGSPHRTYAQARSAAFRGRDWFMVWAGLISFCIRFIEDHRKTQLNTLHCDLQSHLPPHWRVQLRESGFSDAWIDGMDLIARATVDRSGLFIENVSQDPKALCSRHPSCIWWYECGVPLWMRWDPSSWDSVSSSPCSVLLPCKEYWADAAGLALETQSNNPMPSPHHNVESRYEKIGTRNQAAEYSSPNDHRALQPPFASCTLHVGAKSQSLAKEQEDGKLGSWALPSNVSSRVQFSRDYLAEQARVDASLRESESIEQRLRRLNREREAPTVNVKVYVFELDYDDPTKMSLHAVRRKERSDTLRGFSSGQKYYLSSLDVWYCCEEWAPGTDGDDDGDNSDIADFEPFDSEIEEGSIARDPPTQEPRMSRDHVGGPKSILVKESSLQSLSVESLQDHDQPSELQVLPSLTEEGLTSVEDSILRNLSLLYGFVLPLPQLDDTPKLALDTKSQAIFMRQLGYALNRPGVADFLVGDTAAFVHKFVQACTPPNMQYSAEVNGMHDLRHDCHMQLGNGELTRLRKVTSTMKLKLGDKDAASTWYMYDFGRGWAIAVDSPEAALTLCRLGRVQDTLEGMMRSLVGLGFRFRTVGWLNASTLHSLPIPHSRHLPERRSDHCFDSRDYQEYLHTLEGLLTEPRMRAAILRGGVVWRIAYPFVGLEPVLRGPTYQQGWVTQDDHNEDLYIDDDLTPTELKLIVGTYKCWTGLGAQTTLKSWWPPVEAFEGPKCGENYGVWNDFRERWYEDRRSKLLAGKVQPLTTEEWKKTMKGRREITSWKKNVHAEATEFLSKHDM